MSFLSAREKAGLTQREVADKLNIRPIFCFLVGDWGKTILEQHFFQR